MHDHGTHPFRPSDGTVDDVVHDCAAGRMVVVADDTGPGASGHLVLPAAAATPAALGFFARHTSGVLMVSLRDEDLERLRLPVTGHGTACVVPVAAADCPGAGASALARTMRVLADPTSTPGELARPGHVLPVRIDSRGVLGTPRPAEAAHDLAVLARLPPAAASAEIVDDLGEPTTGEALAAFSQIHGLSLVTVSDLIAHRQRTERQLVAEATTRLPLRSGETRAVGYRSISDGTEHLALVYGDLGDGVDVAVHIHTECLLGDVFRSIACSCRHDLDAAMAAIAARGRGVVLFLRPKGSWEAGVRHGVPDSSVTAEILRDLGVLSTRPAIAPADLHPTYAASATAPLTSA